MMAEGAEQRVIWRSFSRALGAELRPDSSIKGASGLEHRIQALAVDEDRNRLIVVAAEATPRTAALMQVDIQSTSPDMRVLVARPVALDISNIVRRVLEPFGITAIDGAQVKATIDHINALPEDQKGAAFDPTLGKVITESLEAYQKVQLPPVEQLIGLAFQAQQLPWTDIMKLFTETASAGVLDLKSLMLSNSMEADLAAGVCPIPLYEFSESDFDLFLSGNRAEEVKERLKSLGVYQYFFPPADHLALGLIDQGVASEASVFKAVQQAPSIGHPLGEMELIATSSGLISVLEQMQSLGYVAEGEHGIEVSEQGKIVRSTVKYRPREGFLTKLMNRFSFSASVSPKDFIH